MRASYQGKRRLAAFTSSRISSMRCCIAVDIVELETKAIDLVCCARSGGHGGERSRGGRVFRQRAREQRDGADEKRAARPRRGEARGRHR
jgi:hypothetical protein